MIPAVPEPATTYETEWSDKSLSLIRARYAKPLPARPKPARDWRNAPAAKANLAERMVPVAADLACMVHGDGSPEDVTGLVAGLKPWEVPALLVVLAGMVDVGRTTEEVLGWVAWEKPAGLQPCPSAAAWKRHRRRGEECAACRDAASAYRAARKREVAAAKRAERRVAA